MAKYFAANGWADCSIITIVKPPDTEWTPSRLQDLSPNGETTLSKAARLAARPQFGRDFEDKPHRPVTIHRWSNSFQYFDHTASVSSKKSHWRLQSCNA